MVQIDNHRFKIELSKDSFDKFQRLLNRLFTGISIKECKLILNGYNLIADVFGHFSTKFRIDLLTLFVDSDRNFSNAIDIMSEFPNSKYGLVITNENVPENEHDLILLPPLEKLSYTCRKRVGESVELDSLTSILLYLVLAHKDLSISNVDLKSDDLTQIFEIISSDERKRTVRLSAKPLIVKNWLNSCGLAYGTRAGVTIAEFTVLRTQRHDLGIGRQLDDCVLLRFRNCWIRFESSNLDDNPYRHAMLTSILGEREGNVMIGNGSECD
ncbi:hypothetical protein PMAYCL1PPCAC_22359 [Pristionchus mayeri]|uniref:Uncharacterized protein n=1 Tax=Pristionchus mayeri TaxID=1317129 RepID=A0AAN5CY04_9BILA|nr:hypothetical protein PMAYCL1PPCAC_22359 [Pristionchus mayeri]